MHEFLRRNSPLQFRGSAHIALCAYIIFRQPHSYRRAGDSGKRIRDDTDARCIWGSGTAALPLFSGPVEPLRQLSWTQVLIIGLDVLHGVPGSTVPLVHLIPVDLQTIYPPPLASARFQR